MSAPVLILLSLGDGFSHDYIDLTDERRHYVRPNGIIAEPAAEREAERTVSLSLVVRGNNPDQLWNNVQLIERKLQQAQQGARPHALTPGVTLSVRLATTEWVYFDVLGGRFTTQELHPGHEIMYALLELRCRPYARGNPITYGPFAMTGSDLIVPLDFVPGDIDALATAVIRDQSINDQVINRIRIGQLSGWGMVNDQATPIVELEATGAGSFVSEPDDSLGGGYVTTSQQTTWQAISRARIQGDQLPPSVYDLWLRLRDHGGALQSPQGVTASGSLLITTQQQHFLFGTPWNVDTFISSGFTTYTIPTGIEEILVEAIGSGGSIIQGNNATRGGGGGAYARSILEVEPGEDYRVNMSRSPIFQELDEGGTGGTILVQAQEGATGSFVLGGEGGSAANSTGQIKFSGGTSGTRSSTAGGGGGGSAGAGGNGGVGGDASGQNGGSGGSAGAGATHEGLALMSGASGAAGGNAFQPGNNGPTPGGGAGGSSSSNNLVKSGGAERLRVAFRGIKWPSPTSQGTLLTLTFLGHMSIDPATVELDTGWQFAGSAQTGDDATAALWYFPDNPGGRTAEKILTSVPGTSAGSTWILNEFTGLKTEDVLDDFVTATSSNATSHPVGPTDILSQQNTLALLGRRHVSGSAGRIVEADNWTSLASGGVGNATGSFELSMRIFETTDAVSATATTAVTRNVASMLAVFKGESEEPASLPAGTYAYTVTPIASAEFQGAPSTPVIATLPDVGGVQLDWEPVLGADHYRVYWQRGSNPILYHTTATNSYFHGTEADGTEGDPNASDAPESLIRPQIGAGDGSFARITLPIRRPALSLSRWEWLYLGTTPWPPTLVSEQELTGNGTVLIETISSIASITLDTNVLLFMPHEQHQVEAMTISSAGTALRVVAKHDWRIHTRRDGRTAALLLKPGLGEPIGSLSARGRFMITPGPGQLIVIPEVFNGVSSVDDAAYELELTLTPRYRYLRGFF